MAKDKFDPSAGICAIGVILTLVVITVIIMLIAFIIEFVDLGDTTATLDKSIVSLTEALATINVTVED